MKKLLRKLTLASLLSGAMALAAQAADPVRIGFGYAKTGIFSQAANSQVKTYEFWRDQVNEDGGLNVGGEKRMIEFVWYDDESNPAKAAQIYERLITSDKVELLLAPWGTPMHLAIAGVVEKHKFPVIGNSAASMALNEADLNYMWFVTPHIPDRMAGELAAFAKEVGVTSAAVITNALPYTQEARQFLLPALDEIGIDVVVEEQYPPDIRDMTAMLTAVKESGADGVLGLAYPGDSFLYMAQAKELGILDIPFQLLLIGPSIPAFKQANGEAVEGLVTMGHWAPDGNANPGSAEFYAAYTERFGEEPDYLDSAESVTSLQIFEAVVATAGLDREKFREEMVNGEFDTIVGKIRFDGSVNATTKSGFIQFQGDTVRTVWPPEDATGTYMPRN